MLLYRVSRLNVETGAYMIFAPYKDSFTYYRSALEKRVETRQEKLRRLAKKIAAELGEEAQQREKAS